MGSLRSLHKEGAKEARPSFDKAMIDFLQRAANYYGSVSIRVRSAVPCRGYLRVFTIEGNELTIKAFVKETTGEIFKPKSIRTPVKVSCGNIFSRNYDLRDIL